MNTKVFSAVYRRNLEGYLGNPANYLILAVFVLLFALAALWPSDSYPANLEQFDKTFLLSLILLGFILAVLLHTWRQEPPPEVADLVVAPPPRGFGVVLGECLGRFAAAVPIFTAGLLLAVVVVYLIAGLASSGFGVPFIGWQFAGSCVGHWLRGFVLLAALLLTSPVLRAVFRRNFVAYFANPTGYLFICVFVLLGTISAFWPNEFFVTNLANLDQLNNMFPFIMLMFIPAVTMAVWADERRQGTDELLLTVPAGDLDIVLGKYLAAVAIYSVALLFSALCNFWILRFLSTPGPGPDGGLFLGTYVGYWLVGLAMLAIGMSASFLTSNLTLAYIWGALFNVPLVFAVKADMIASREMALVLKQWSISERFADFGGGILSLSGFVYFAAIVIVLLYLSMVFIGRRHWTRGGEAGLMGDHFLVRVGALVLIAVGAVVFFTHYDVLRSDVTLERLSSLSPDTIKLLDELKIERPVQIEAFISSAVPETYVQTRADLLSMLRELDKRGGEKVGVRINDTEQFTEEAARAEQRYDVTPREVTTEERGSYSQDFLFMGVAFTCGLEKVILPFIDRGVPVEYELVRSLCTVAQPNLIKAESLEELNLQRRPVLVTALISGELPDSYEKTRSELEDVLARLKKLGEEQVIVDQYVDPSSGLMAQLGVSPHQISAEEDGKDPVEVLLHVVLRCGADKREVSFASGESSETRQVEEELASAISAISQESRRRIGVVDTDAQLYGQFNMQTMSPPSNWPIVEELEKQYQVERVDATNPIDEDKYDALLAVQPSSLGPEQMDNFVDAVRSGVPTAIFEDPFPLLAGNVPGTTAPRRPPGGMNPMMMGRQPPMEKGNRAALWDLLKVDFAETKVVWQDHNPHRRFRDWFKEFVFVDEASGAKEPFSESDAATSGLQHMLFPFPGSIRSLNVSDHKFTPLVQTGKKTGTVDSDDVVQFSPFGRGGLNRNRRQVPTGVSYVLAAHIRGKVENDASVDGDNGNGNGDGDHNGGEDSENPSAGADAATFEEGAETDAPPFHAFGEGEEAAEARQEPSRRRKPGIDVVLVADIDLLSGQFFRLREMGEVPEAGVRFDFDNVTFVLNVLDRLAGDDRFLEIRKRHPRHRTLTRIEENMREAREKTAEQIEDLRDKVEQIEEEEDEKLRKRVSEMEEKLKKEGLRALHAIATEVGMAQQAGEQRKQAKLERLGQETETEINQIRTEQALKERRLQDAYKMWAVILPPIPLLLVAVGVFFTRRIREREGVARSRLRAQRTRVD